MAADRGLRTPPGIPWSKELAAVFLDELLVRGDDRRAALVRAEVDGLPPPAHAAEVLGSLQYAVNVETTRFGLPWAVELVRPDVRTLKRITGAREWAPVGRLIVPWRNKGRVRRRRSDAVAALIAHPAMASLVALSQLDESALEAVGNGPVLPRIRMVELSQTALEVPAIDTPSLPGLETVFGNCASDSTLQAPFTRRAAFLYLAPWNDLGLTSSALAALASPGRINRLEVWNPRLDVEARREPDGWRVCVRTTPYLAVALVRTCPREVRRLRLLLNTQGEGMPPLHRLAAARGIELEVEEAPLESAA